MNRRPKMDRLPDETLYPKKRANNEALTDAVQVTVKMSPESWLELRTWAMARGWSMMNLVAAALDEYLKSPPEEVANYGTPGETDKRIVVKVPHELHEKLRDYSVHVGASNQDIVVGALNSYSGLKLDLNSSVDG